MGIAEQWQYCMEDRRVRSMDVNVAYDQIKGIIYSLRCFLVRHNVATDLSTESDWRSFCIKVHVAASQ